MLNILVINREYLLLTDGTNLRGVMAEESIDFKTVYTNDIKEILEVLGIEAARHALMKEIRKVMTFGGSYVNHRHLSILCDVMTYKGFLMPITRNGINRIDASPLQKASYEETQEIFMEAAVFAEKDKLLGVSENVMTGQFLRTGTGVFDVYLDTQKLAEAVDIAPDGDDISMRFISEDETDHAGNYASPVQAGWDDSLGGESSPQFSPGFVNASPGMEYDYSELTASPSYTMGVAGGMGSGGGFSGASPSYAGGMGGGTIASPVYSPASPTSPAYSPTSPAYSPTTSNASKAKMSGDQSEKYDE